MASVFAWLVSTGLSLAQLPPHIELGEVTSPQGTRILEVDQLGAVAAPDLDGDGFDDFVLAAPLSHFDGSYSGSVYILFGPLGTPYGLAPEAEFPARGLRVDGPEPHARLGHDLGRAGDLNGDGIDDLALASLHETWVIFGGAHLRGLTSIDLSALDGTLGFRLTTALPGTSRHVLVPVGDANADGVEDLFIGLPGKDEPWTSIPLANDVRSVVVGDVDGDGDQDILAAEGDYGTIALLRNAGDGTFPSRTTLTQPANRELYLHDLDGDDDLDLVVGFDKFLSGGVVEGSFAVFKNPGDGAFVLQEQHRIDAVGRGVDLTFGDIDGDGDDDLAGINFSEDTGSSPPPVTAVSTFTNDGSGHFTLRHTRQFSYLARSVVLLDADGDLDRDVLVGTYANVSTTATVRIHPNNGSGAFGGGTQLLVPGLLLSLAAVDLDGDGLEDLFSSSMFFLNSPGGLLPGVRIDYARSFVGRGRMADFDGSGTLDLVVSDDHDGVLVNLNLNPGSGVFDEQRLYSYGAVRGEPVCADLDGDGDLDVVVEDRARVVLAFQRPGGLSGASCGAGFVVFGRTGIGSGGTLDLDALDGTDGFHIPGAEAGACMGQAVSRAGDMNGDGHDDFLFVAPFTDGGRGDVFVVYGRTGLGSTGVLDPFVLTPATGIRIHGIERESFCRVVIGDLDVDGDGRPDLVCGGPGQSIDGLLDAGRVSVVFGSEALVGEGTFDLRDLDGTRGYSITGGERTFIGVTLVRLGDQNGDGRDDFAAGGTGDETHGENTGVVFVVLGARRGPAAEFSVLSLPGRQGVALHPQLEDSYLGRDLATGDWNADGRPDLYLPSRALFPGAPEAGSVHILFDLGRVRYRRGQL